MAIPKSKRDLLAFQTLSGADYCLYEDEMLTPIINPTVINSMLKKNVSVKMHQKLYECILCQGRHYRVQCIIRREHIEEQPISGA